ncbi:MAG: ABC transporter permease [Gemmatimonadaceae bacterium]
MHAKPLLRFTRVRAVAMREWMETVRNRTFLLISLIIPGMMLGMMVLPGVLLERRGISVPPTDSLFANQTTLGLVLVVFLFLGITSQAQALLRSVIEERGNRMIEVILSSIHPLELLLGKIIGYAAVAATQFAFWLVSGAALSKVAGLPFAMRFYQNAGWETLILFAACYAAGYLLYASIYATVGAVLGGEREAVLYQQLLGLVLIAPLVVTAALAGEPGDVLVQRLTWFPLMTPTLVLLRSAFNAITISEIAGSLTLTAITALLMLSLAARFFRGTTLLSSRRMTWREAWRATESGMLGSRGSGVGSREDRTASREW